MLSSPNTVDVHCVIFLGQVLWIFLVPITSEQHPEMLTFWRTEDMKEVLFVLSTTVLTYWSFSLHRTPLQNSTLKLWPPTNIGTEKYDGCSTYCKPRAWGCSPFCTNSYQNFQLWMIHPMFQLWHLDFHFLWNVFLGQKFWWKIVQRTIMKALMQMPLINKICLIHKQCKCMTECDKCGNHRKLQSIYANNSFVLHFLFNRFCSCY